MSVAPEPSPDSRDQPTAPLVSAGNSDRCASCGAHLATDQRYCVECGTRRGAPRFALTGQTTAPAVAAGSQSARSGAGSRFMRYTSGTAMLVGLLIVLVALGVGVLIGHNSTPKQNKTSVVVNDTGGGSSGSAATAAPAAANPTGSSGSATGGSSTSTKKKSSSTSKVSKKTAAAAAATNPNASATGKAGTAAAAKSFGSSATSKSTVGGSCTAGTPGCSKSGKQTGNLFP